MRRSRLRRNSIMCGRLYPEALRAGRRPGRLRAMSAEKLEAWLARWAQDSADVMPARWRRWLAMHYPDARVRRFFWRRTGVEMGEDTYANYGMIVIDDHAATGQSLVR